SPFTPQLGTNYCPTDEEVLEIQDLLVQPTLRLKRLDDEIADLQKARESLGTYVAAHRALISPVRRLPLDIVQEIFIACLPADRNCVMSASESPVLLGRICSSWRAISLSTPRLWASLHIAEPSRPPDSDMSFEKKYIQRLETMKAWLRRSGDCPLSISLQCALDLVVGIPLEGPLFLQSLIPFAPRWRAVNFTDHTPRLIEVLSNLTESDVPILQDLVLWERPRHMDPVPLSPDKRWASAGILRGPRISKFSISAEKCCLTELPLRWSQLTSLSLEERDWNSLSPLTGDKAVQILSLCPALRTCRLAVVDTEGPYVENPGVASIAECPQLNAMYLCCRGSPDLTLPEMFRRLSLPKLRQLVLRGYGRSEPHIGLSFRAVWMRLESLDISTDTFSRASLADLLNSLPPTMRRLDITCVWTAEISFDDDTFAILTPSHDRSPCCPALQELTIKQCYVISDEALWSFIDGRMSSEFCSPLERVEVRFGREMQFDILPGLRQFMDAGLHVALEYAAPSPSQFSPWQGLPPPAYLDEAPCH
ncbi:hypothetical protein B0H13DRAFT_2418564, partial [Mycena leptocephala]